jgi:thioredoxin 2
MADAKIDRSGVIVSCASCGRANRLHYPAIGKTTRCGHCKTPLGPPSTPLAVTDAAGFEAAAQGALPLIVDFWAPWCGPCRMVAPELQKVAREAAGRFLVVKVNTDELTDLASRFRIQSIPTLAVVSRGREIDRIAGARSAADILAFAQQALAADARRAS